MLENLYVGVNGYDAYEGYLNHQIFEELGKHQLPFVTRGTLVMTSRPNINSEEFFKEIKTWLNAETFEIITACSEQFAYPALTIFAKSISPVSPGSDSNAISFGYFVFHADNLTFDVFAETYGDANKIALRLEEKFKAGTKSVGGNIKFAFWQQDDEDDCDVTTNNKSCPSLEEIRTNYSSGLYQQIEKVIALKEPYNHGKIILYHGAAGNGKTHLIRALARAWNEIHGVIPEVIIDPERLYETPKYLTSLLLSGANRIYSSKVEPPFRLIIAEDCAQLFGTDCRNQSGFSRLLNTVDGLLGQGQKLIFVFTANEQIDTIDPAILRPGRCLQNLEVPNWNRAAAREWLKAKGVTDTSNLPNDISLAEMYAILNKTMHAEQRHQTLGF